MPEVKLTISPSRFCSALRSGEATGLLPSDHEQILSMDLDDVRARAEQLVFIMLAPEVRWVEQRNIPCTIRLTADDLVFIFVFEKFADALLFRLRWSPEPAELATEQEFD